MATLATLLDVETEVELVLKTHFAATPYNLAATTSDTAIEVVTPRLGIVAEVSKWGPHQYTPTTGTYLGREIYDQFLVRTDLSLVYEPEAGQSQGVLRGTMRSALTDFSSIQSGFATRGYLFIAGSTMRQTEGSRTIQNDEKTQTISSTLEFAVFLNPSALNSAT